MGGNDYRKRARTYLDTKNSLCPLIRGEEPGVRRGVREKEPAMSSLVLKDSRCDNAYVPVGDGRGQSESAGNDHQPLPWGEVLGMNVERSETDEARDNLSCNTDVRQFCVEKRYRVGIYLYRSSGLEV